MVTPTRLRNVEFEREITRFAVKGLNVDPEPLITFAEARIATHHAEYVADPRLVSTAGDRIRDAREEAADLRNYLVWWLEENLEDERRSDREKALRHVCLLFDLLGEGS